MYIGPRDSGSRAGKKILAVIFIAGIISSVMIFFFQGDLFGQQAGGDRGAIILFVSSLVALIMAIIIGIIAKKRSNETDE